MLKPRVRQLKSVWIVILVMKYALSIALQKQIQKDVLENVSHIKVQEGRNATVIHAKNDNSWFIQLLNN